MDEVFRAINDPSRRLLLDKLFDEDGQTLGELCRHLPSMTRYGVMSHLRVLEDAGLITTRKVGRSKNHYLNPVPIRLIHDRWISKYAEPTVGAISALKAHLEGGRPPMSKPVHIYKAYIRATIDEVWEAIVDGEKTAQYFYGTRVESDWTVGSSMNYYDGNGNMVSKGEVLAIDPPKRLEFTFAALWDPALVEEGSSRQVWAIAEINGMSELTIELFDVAEGGAIYEDFTNGFPYIVSGLKSLLETGHGLPAPY
ncbi:MAG: SRPBCC domain-containing protein [Acidimicrobiia bacterium]|nr:SRPBCC domain-containing protein [Acidimicrobiia bacterium]MDH3462721.1 SRPBCC domain-containing protein [Acidimicrobiia bacterium]